jgi:FKBP-type peptidyl-prolyl cis-trans isomerase FkpA
MILRFCTIFLIFLCFISCNPNKEKSKGQKKPEINEMADLNRYFVQKDRERIQNYIERKNLKMIESLTGLWYFIKNDGSGKRFTDNDIVLMRYNCSLLDGTQCYSSDELGPKEVIIGITQMERGLNEGLRMLREGAEATFILPPFLAFGLIGDGKKIPPRAVIIYNVNILHAK